MKRSWSCFFSRYILQHLVFFTKCYFEQPIHFSYRYDFNIFSLIYLKQKLLRQTYSFFHAWRLHCVYFLGIPFRWKLIRIHGTHFIPPNFNPNFLKKIKTQIQLNILMNAQFASTLDISYYTFTYFDLIPYKIPFGIIYIS